MAEVRRPGPILIVGGGMGSDGAEAPSHAFVRLAGGRDARIGVAPTASDTWRSTGRELAAMFEDAGAGEARVVLVRDRYDAASPQIARELEGLSGVFFSGGNQSQLVRALGNSVFLDRLKEVWRDGVVVGGTSAGASAMSTIMISSGRAGLCERTALAIEADGHAEVVGEGVVFIVRMDETLPGTDWSPGPERVSAALRVHVSGDRLRLW